MTFDSGNRATHIGVAGAGAMGSGIAHVFARSGFSVTLCDFAEGALDRAAATIAENLGREVHRGAITEQERAAAIARIRGSAKLDSLAHCAIAIEAIHERFEAKRKLFEELDRILPQDSILASNTSSISITRLAGVTSRPDRVIGMHFFNPVPIMTLVEVVRGIETSDETARAVVSLVEQLGKTPVEVNDSPGFVSNRVLMPLLNEAMFALMEGVASAESIDTVFKLGMAHPMGPLTLADFIGLDVCLDILRVLVEETGDAKYRPCPLLVRMVSAGWLGRKTGKGFYTYPDSRA